MPDGRKQLRRLIEDEAPVDPGTLGFWARQHLRRLEVLNYSRLTLRGREKHLRYFLAWANERAIIKPEQVSVAVLERYQRHNFYAVDQRGKQLSYREQNTRLLALRVFFRWLAKQRVIEMSPAELLELPRPEYHLPKNILSVGEVEAMMNACDITTPQGIRDRAVNELLYSSGLRRLELCNLKLWDVDTADRIVRVRQGKGKRDRIVPMGERAALWIRKYLDQVRPGLATEPDDGHLFLTRLHAGFTHERVSEIVRRAAKSAGLGRIVSPHLLRHTMATMMLDGGADVRYVQAMLGHVDINTTVIYTRVAIKRLKQVHELSHPGAKLTPQQTAQQIDEQTSMEIAKETLFSSLAAEAAEEKNEESGHTEG